MHRVISIRQYCFAATAILLVKLAGAASYSEFVDGDLPDNGQSPTPFALDEGANLLVAQSSAVDYDMLRIIVPANHTLDSVIVEQHDDINRVFAGVEAGPVWTAGTGFDVDPSLMLGWVDFPTDPGHTHTGEDILDDIGLGAGAIGFVPPLPSGDYTFLFQAPSSAVNFALSFNVSTTGAGLSADFNADNVVNGTDLSLWRSDFGVNGRADADRDGDTDGADMLVWQRSLGAAAAASTNRSVPESGASALAAEVIACLAALRRKAPRFRRRRESVVAALRHATSFLMSSTDS